MTHLVLTGATGLVGGSVLAHILSLPPSTSIARLSILSRSPVPLASKQERTNTTTQIEVIQHTDYENYPPEVLAKLKGATGVIWAQGISQTEVDAATYVKITKDYPIAAAKAFAGLTDNRLNFVHVSGEGATYKPGRFTQLFARVKGEAELALIDMAKQAPYSTLRVYNVRPGGVDGRSQPEVWEPTIARRGVAWRILLTLAAPPMNLLAKNMMIQTPQLGKALTELALEDGEPLKGKGVESDGRLVRNLALRSRSGLPT